MTLVAFDTHQAVKRLEDAGHTPSQAEAITSLVQETRDADLEHLATKADLEQMATTLELELKLWTAGLAVGLATVIIGAMGTMKFLP